MRDELPALLAEIAEVAGLDAALAIADAKGGIVVRIASRLKPENWLVECVGMEKAKLISEYFTAGRGLDLLIPLGPTGSYKRDQQRRAQAYQRALASGNNIQQIARQVGVTRRSVERFKKRLSTTGNTDQGDLF